jgi:membrane protease YdiL (CAAX protease family)
METRGRIQRKVITFLILTFALSSVFYFLMASAGSTKAAGGLYELALMWCPGVAALVTQFSFQRNLRGLGWGLPQRRFLALPYFLPVLYGLVTYVVVWLTGLGGFSPQQLAATIGAQINYHSTSPVLFTIIYVLIAATVLMIPGILSALGEEIGWRGLLVPELARTTTFTRTALLSGVIWVVWHLPLILFSNYNSGAPAWFAVTCFAVMTLAFSFAFAWLRLKSGSVWVAVLLHASHNVWIKNVFTPLTSNTGITAYVIDEFGIALAITLVLIGLYFWRRQGELSSSESVSSLMSAAVAGHQPA